MKVSLLLFLENYLLVQHAQDQVPVSARMYSVVGTDSTALSRRALQVLLPYHIHTSVMPRQTQLIEHQRRKIILKLTLFYSILYSIVCVGFVISYDT